MSTTFCSPGTRRWPDAAARFRDCSGDDWRAALSTRSARSLAGDLWTGDGRPAPRRLPRPLPPRLGDPSSRVAAEICRDLQRWIAEGRSLGPRRRRSSESTRRAAAPLEGTSVGRLRPAAVLEADYLVDRDRAQRADASASPLLGAGLDRGWLRVGPMGQGVDADPDTLRVIDVGRPADGPAWAIGLVRDVLRGERVPEIRVHGRAGRGGRRCCARNARLIAPRSPLPWLEQALIVCHR